MFRNFLPFIKVSAALTTIYATNFLIAADTTKIPALVLYCSDGDTCRIKVDDAMWMNVRLAGVDAPEVAHRGRTGQKAGDTAKDFLNEQLKDKTVSLRQTDLDQYNRPVVEIFIGEQLVNLTLIEKGFAEAYRGPAKRLDRSAYYNAEEDAKKNSRGIWAISDYVSPSEFRKSQKSKGGK